MALLVFTFEGKETGYCSLENSSVVLGSQPGVTVHLESPGISEKHCMFERDPDGYLVSDLGSEDGTFVNGERIEQGRLSTGDIITTGTPSGVGFARTPPEFLKPGDEITCSIDGVGSIRNRIAR